MLYTTPFKIFNQGRNGGPVVKIGPRQIDELHIFFSFLTLSLVIEKSMGGPCSPCILYCIYDCLALFFLFFFFHYYLFIYSVVNVSNLL